MPSFYLLSLATGEACVQAGGERELFKKASDFIFRSYEVYLQYVECAALCSCVFIYALVHVHACECVKSDIVSM